MLRFIDTNLKGSGQVMFQGNALTGLLFLVGIFWGAIAADTITVAIGAVVGLVVSTVTGMMLHSDDDSMRIGLYGYNGVLVGAAFPTFLAGGVMLWIYLVVGAAASTIAFLAVANVFKTWGVPALTFPFNLVNWFFLLAAFQFLRIERQTSARASFPSTSGTRQFMPKLLQLPVGHAVPQRLPDLSDQQHRHRHYLRDRAAGRVALGGVVRAHRSAIAMGSVLALGANTVDIGNGLYGLSSVLTAIALGSVFYNPSWRVFVYTVFGVLVTVVIHGTLVSAFAPISLPAGTGPFVFATWLFLLPKKKFVPSSTTPSRVERPRARIRSRRRTDRARTGRSS